MLKNTVSAVRDLFFPHYCAGCAVDFISPTEVICTRCKTGLPETHFFTSAINPVSTIFTGRIPIEHAGALYYFTKNSLLQRLLIHLKYKNNTAAGYFLGNQLGKTLAVEERYATVDMIIALPLHPKKEISRGYNQAEVIVRGIEQKWRKEICTGSVIRLTDTKTQTHENRIGRWENMKGVFAVTEPKKLLNKHILLVDDVITTGATLEACGAAILSVPGTKLSIAAVGYTL